MVNDSLFQVGHMRRKVYTFSEVQHEVKCSLINACGWRTKGEGAWIMGYWVFSAVSAVRRRSWEKKFTWGNHL